ncbi:MAG TPA: hypothetical protein VF028_06200, partial [Actinomycetota bacterium]|nr:hypothetical protein [Actinomycetota bacterium]
GASVTVIGPAGEALEDALEIPIDATDRALVSAASLVPIQLLSWRLASELGRDPGVYLRASKVTTRE